MQAIHRAEGDGEESPPTSNGQKEFKKGWKGGSKYGGGSNQDQRERKNPKEAINTVFKEPTHKILPKIIPNFYGHPRRLAT